MSSFLLTRKTSQAVSKSEWLRIISSCLSLPRGFVGFARPDAKFGEAINAESALKPRPKMRA